MDDLGIRREVGELARNAVGEARAYRNKQVGVGNRIVGVHGAVHAHQAQVQRVGRREGALAHKRVDHRDLQLFSHSKQLFLGMGGDDAAADVQDGALGFLHHLGSLADLAQVALHRGLVRRDKHVLGVLEHHFRAGKVGRDVDEHRAGTAGVGDVEGLAEGLGHVLAALQQVAVLHDGHGDAHDVGLLEGIGADDAARNLAGDNHHGHAVHVSGGDAGYRVGGARAGGDDYHAGLAGCAGIAVGLVRCALLVAGKHVVDLLRVVQGIVDLDGLATRVAEHGVYALGLERGDDGLGAEHLLALLFGMGAKTHLGLILLVDYAHPKYAPLSALETSLA